MAAFLMPSLGADMEAGTLVEWLKQPGEAVRRGDIVAVVETQKGAIEIEIFETGILERLLVEPGTRVPVGTPLALVTTQGEAPAAAAPPAPAPTPPPAPAPAPPSPPGAAVRASPAARRLAAERGLSLAGIEGSGPGGAIVSADLARAAPAAGGKAPAAGRHGLDLAEMRQAIAAAMARSKREIPHYYLSQAIDMSAPLGWLEGVNAGREPADRLLPAVLLLKAVALALKAYPEFNGFHQEGAFRAADGIHPGVAVAIRGGGLVAPAIQDADGRSLNALMAALRDLVARVRGGRLRSSELFEPTVTVSSLGERGVDSLFGVIYPPQVAILGFGTPRPRPWVVEGRVEPRPVVTATLAADHRASDGHRGALLLLEIERLLQHPEAL